MIRLEDIAPKHPTSSKWYWLAWSDVELNGATITGATWTPPAGITVDESQFTDLLTGVRLSGGTLGQYYEVGVAVQTSDSQLLHETLTVEISERGH
ncbi:MAG: hypothetical protein KZQ99_04520 [Candidatus Thiodiazotropha sp. (ex Dulcina madagascariensis)]|nr:hypothetical protein [Candidatus Thiodiazotropha sp. (ex Dulcina madagascariensis)]